MRFVASYFLLATFIAGASTFSFTLPNSYTFLRRNVFPLTSSYTPLYTSSSPPSSTPPPDPTTTDVDPTPLSSDVYNIYEIVRRKEVEITNFAKLHTSPSDPLQLRLGYISESSDMVKKKRFARSLRRKLSSPKVFPPPDSLEDPAYPFNTHYLSVGVDVKRRSPTAPHGGALVDFDSAGPVARALADLGADFLFCNVDGPSYGGSLEDLSSTVSSLKALSRETNRTAPSLVMKDVVVSLLQLAVAAEAGCDAVLLLACVLGSDLEDFLNAATLMDLDCIVECHTELELSLALKAGATYLLVNRYDRVKGNLLARDQVFDVLDAFPPAGFVTTLAAGDFATPEEAGELLDAGYDGVVLGKAIMGNDKAGELIKAIREVEGGSGKHLRSEFGF